MRSVLARVLAGVVATAPAAPSLAAEGTAKPASAETAALGHLVDLAIEPTFALVVSPGASKLTLELEGAVLREFPIESLQEVAPRVLFVWRSKSPADTEWMEQIWRGGALDPPRKRDRIEIQAPPPDPNRPEGSVEAPIPPLAEEAIVAPERYFIRFDGGMALEICGIPRRRSMLEVCKQRWQDVVSALRFHARDQARLRLFLATEDSDALYRSLPPGVNLLVLPATLQADGSEVAPRGGTSPNKGHLRTRPAGALPLRTPEEPARSPDPARSPADSSAADSSAVDSPAVDSPAVDSPAVDSSAVDSSAVGSSALDSSGVSKTTAPGVGQ